MRKGITGGHRIPKKKKNVGAISVSTYKRRPKGGNKKTQKVVAHKRRKPSKTSRRMYY